MESTIVRNSDNERITAVDANVIYRESVRKQFSDELKRIFDVETQRATLEIMEAHRKAMRQIVEDYRSTIHQVVEEEKVEIWKKAETLKKSMLAFGL